MSGPFIKSTGSVRVIMFDVIIALLPLSIAAWWAFGSRSLTVIACSVLSCVLCDLLCELVFLQQRKYMPDGSGIITGLLLAYTLSPLTPWYVVVFAAVCAVLFGKVLWGGLGKNKFNPALVGREFATAFFPASMTGASIWNTSFYVEHRSLDIFSFVNNAKLADSLEELVYRPAGALGEYSLPLLLLGGIYLVFRNRITLHIPLAFLIGLSLCQVIFPAGALAGMSIGGLLLGGIYMATDMPTSPSHHAGKLFYGLALALIVATLYYNGVRFAYMSYGILILNGVSDRVNEVFKPVSWGRDDHLSGRWERITLLSLFIAAITLAVISLHQLHAVPYLVYLLAAYILFKYYTKHQYTIIYPF